jgi:hypothetical protein
MSYMDHKLALIGGIRELEINELDIINGGGRTSDVAAHVAATAQIVAIAAIEAPPVAIAAEVVAVVAGLVAIWS